MEFLCIFVNLKLSTHLQSIRLISSKKIIIKSSIQKRNKIICNNNYLAHLHEMIDDEFDNLIEVTLYLKKYFDNIIVAGVNNIIKN